MPILMDTTTVEVVNHSYAVGWGALSLVNAGLAQSKNRSGFGWWLISLLLGPVATFLLVALCDKLPDPAASRSSN